MDLRETYNKIAKDWGKKNSGVTWSTAYVERFAKLFESGAWILDVGCGPGNKAKELAAFGLNVHGIDISEEMISVARGVELTGTFEVLDIHNLDKLEERYDGILAIAVLLHLKKSDVPEVVRSLWSKLKPGGYCYVAVKEWQPGEPEEKMVNSNDLGYDYERFFSYFTMDELKKSFEGIGEIILEEKHPERSTVWLNLIVRKPQQ